MQLGWQDSFLVKLLVLEIGIQWLNLTASLDHCHHDVEVSHFEFRLLPPDE